MPRNTGFPVAGAQTDFRRARLVGERTEAEAYLLVARERYKLIRTHEWSEEIIERLRGALTS